MHNRIWEEHDGMLIQEQVLLGKITSCIDGRVGVSGTFNVVKLLCETCRLDLWRLIRHRSGVHRDKPVAVRGRSWRSAAAQPPLNRTDATLASSSASAVVVFCHAVVLLLLLLLLLLPCCSEGQPLLIGPSKPVVAVTGDDVILPCHLEPAADAVSMSMEWTRPDLKPRFVHVRHGGQDLLENQNPAYEGRTSASIDRLKDGNVSLKLSDAGTYRCFFPLLHGDTFVQLIVGAVSSPVIVSVNRVSDKVDLQCESAGWYPEPEVLWLDGEGNLISAGPPETVRGPDDLYTVSSRVTVEKRHGNSFTCRVQQRNINHTTETHITVSEDVFAAPSSAAVRVIIILSVCVPLSCICAALLVLGKRRQNKGRKSHVT
uniref:butyrophilin-like protein 10 n=1 Tax=Epinephelus lanceolatus TaxID=310571 RepID=UPI00144892CA|nr:butyrophilin-like protein 10 [Epinephelus lanceolatus]